MMYRRELQKLKDKDGNVPHTVKSKNEFQGPSSNKTRVRTFRDNPKAIKHAQRIKMLKTFICPPLIVGSEGDLFSVRSLLDVAAKDKFTLELSETGEIRIYPSDSFTYFDIANMLLENDLPLRGLKQGGKNEFKAICVGLHPEEDLKAVQEALGKLGHDVCQISRPLDIDGFPPMLPIYTITLERAENNWEIFNVTKLLGMRVTFRPPARVPPPPQCMNCLQIGHFEYECGRRLCDSCDCSFIRGRNIIAKLVYEWPLNVKARDGAPEPKKQVRKGIKRLSDRNTEQEHATNGSHEASNKAQEAVHEPQEENNELQEANNLKIEGICRIERTSLRQDGWKCKFNEPEEANKKKSFKSKIYKKMLMATEGSSKRKYGYPFSSSVVDKDDTDDDETEEEKFNLMGYESSDSSVMSMSSMTTTYSSSTTDDSAIFNNSSISSDKGPNVEEPEGLKTVLKEWYFDVTALEEQKSFSSSSSYDSLNPLKIYKNDEEEKMIKRPLVHEQEMLTCNFIHTRHSKSHGKAKEGANPLGRRPIIKRKKVHRYTTSIGCGTYTRVNIVKERPQSVEGEKEKDEEQYEENEVHTLLMSAKYSLDTEANHSRQESLVGDNEGGDETDDEGNDGEDDEEVNEDDERADNRGGERDDGRRHYRNSERDFNDFQRNLDRDFQVPPKIERKLYWQPVREVVRDLQLQTQNDLFLARRRRQEFPILFLSMLRDKLDERAKENLARRSFVPERKPLAERYATVLPTSIRSSVKFHPTICSRRHTHKYKTFVSRYTGADNNEEIPDDIAREWLDMIYSELEILLNHIDRIGRDETYGIIIDKVMRRYDCKQRNAT